MRGSERRSAPELPILPHIVPFSPPAQRTGSDSGGMRCQCQESNSAEVEIAERRSAPGLPILPHIVPFSPPAQRTGSDSGGMRCQCQESNSAEFEIADRQVSGNAVYLPLSERFVSANFTCINKAPRCVFRKADVKRQIGR